MKPEEKIELLKKLCGKKHLNASFFYVTLEKCDIIKTDYREYLTTPPISCDKELLRLPKADYDLCCALITMLLREDHFSNGSFEIRYRRGQIQPIIERIIFLLSQNQ